LFQAFCYDFGHFGIEYFSLPMDSFLTQRHICAPVVFSHLTGKSSAKNSGNKNPMDWIPVAHIAAQLRMVGSEQTIIPV